jgi:hypothetical protein
MIHFSDSIGQPACMAYSKAERGELLTTKKLDAVSCKRCRRSRYFRLKQWDEAHPKGAF